VGRDEVTPLDATIPSMMVIPEPGCTACGKRRCGVLLGVFTGWAPPSERSERGERPSR